MWDGGCRRRSSTSSTSSTNRSLQLLFVKGRAPFFTNRDPRPGQHRIIEDHPKQWEVLYKISATSHNSGPFSENECNIKVCKNNVRFFTQISNLAIVIEREGVINRTCS